MIARFNEEHDRIRSLAATLDTYLRAPSAPVDPGFARCRWELMRQLSAHLAAERNAMTGTDGAARIRALVGPADASLDQGLRAHMIEWTGEAIRREWPSYRLAARALLRKLGARMAYEERVIFPLLR